MDLLSRRSVLAATAAGGLAAAASATAETYQKTAPFVNGKPDGGHGPGPFDAPQVDINPSEVNPIPTDHGNLGILKYSFSEAHNRRTDAGWVREVTVRNFPVSKAMAGVDMRLPAGAIRELHWHLPAEWAYVTYGTARITAVDQDARRFVADVKEGDLWFFPSGIPHPSRGLGRMGASSCSSSMMGISARIALSRSTIGSTTRPKMC